MLPREHYRTKGWRRRRINPRAFEFRDKAD